MAEERLEEIRQARLKKRTQLIATGQFPYPAEVRRTHTLAEIQKEFDHLLTDHAPVMVIGRVIALREHGGVIFIDIRDASDVLQLQLTRSVAPTTIFERAELLDIGDFLQAAGKLTRTQRGTQTLEIHEFHIISKSIRSLPSTRFGLKDHEARYRQREVDLLLNPSLRNTFTLRETVSFWLRTFLRREGFTEVETPILQSLPGGASARPFTTHHHALDISLYLRIAPELYLKRLLVSGYEKVFELGRTFRNEGVDRHHNPEFTMLELYWAYADYEDLMDFVEQLFDALVRSIFDASEVEWQDHTLSFEPPLKRIRFIDLMSKQVGFDILTEKNPQTYMRILERENVPLPDVQTYPKLIDELYKELIRPMLIEPTILYDYPAEFSPLAKQNLRDPRVAEQFQVVIANTEIVKAYTEQNDPILQRQRFEEQQEAAAAGDTEAQPIDESYLRALEYGMPPAAGLGLGIDRLVMILANVATLRDTILFPLLRPE